MTPRSESERARRGDSTSRSLLAHARQDDPAAWSRLVKLYAPLVAAWCRRWGVAEQDALDLVQEVFAAVARNLPRFRKEEAQDTFRGWLATIARNKVRDYYRRRSAEPIAVGGTEALTRMAQVLDPEALCEALSEECPPTEDSAFAAVLQRALTAIKPDFQERTWQAFWSVVVEGRSTSETAVALGMRPGTVRVSKSRVLVRLRRELGDVQE
jgi:RNA polymerase sigma-70 factor (ECF subfamily)